MKSMFFGLAAAAAMATSASAAPVLFNFDSPTGTLGTTQTYTDTDGSGLKVVASGFNNLGGATDLHGKANGGDENGLGLANDPTGDGEIAFGKGFVQLDVSGLIGKVVGSLTDFKMGSTSGGEQWEVFGSNTSGSFSGSPLISGSADGVSELLPDFGAYKFYDFVEKTDVWGDNVLLASLSSVTAVPEPASWALMLLGVGGLGAALRRHRKTAGQSAFA